MNREAFGLLLLLTIGALAGFAAARAAGQDWIISFTWAALGFTWMALFISWMMIRRTRQIQRRIRDFNEQRSKAWLS